MNHFDTTRQIIMSRISKFTGRYNQGQLEDLVAYQMRSYAIMFHKHNKKDRYLFDSFDVDSICNIMINLIRPR